MSSLLYSVLYILFIFYILIFVLLLLLIYIFYFFSLFLTDVFVSLFFFFLLILFIPFFNMFVFAQSIYINISKFLSIIIILTVFLYIVYAISISIPFIFNVRVHIFLLLYLFSYLFLCVSWYFALFKNYLSLYFIGNSLVGACHFLIDLFLVEERAICLQFFKLSVLGGRLLWAEVTPLWRIEPIENCTSPRTIGNTVVSEYMEHSRSRVELSCTITVCLRLH